MYHILYYGCIKTGRSSVREYLGSHICLLCQVRVLKHPPRLSCSIREHTYHNPLWISPYRTAPACLVSKFCYPNWWRCLLPLLFKPSSHTFVVAVTPRRLTSSGIRAQCVSLPSFPTRSALPFPAARAHTFRPSQISIDATPGTCRGTTTMEKLQTVTHSRNSGPAQNTPEQVPWRAD